MSEFDLQPGETIGSRYQRDVDEMVAAGCPVNIACNIAGKSWLRVGGMLF